MIPAAAAMLAELEREAPATRRVLERVPEDRYPWRPHAKSMTAGQLAQHVAAVLGGISKTAAGEGMDLQGRGQSYAAAESRAALLATWDASLAAARSFLEGLEAARAEAPFRVHHGERTLFVLPRLEILRTMAFNHTVHHRGELVVYLRLLDVPVPIVYGRSADENPFAPPV
jgi:uncharacterized damage-inducible protein DinB